VAQNLHGCQSEERLQLLTGGLLRINGLYAAGLMEHWRQGDSTVELEGITYILHGKRGPQAPGPRKRGSGGVGIALTRDAVRAWRRAGSYVEYFGDRWIIIHLQEFDQDDRRINIVFAVAYAPVSSASFGDCETFFAWGCRWLERVGSTSIVIIVVDANGAMGTSTEASDPVGRCGVPTRNESGNRWRNWLSLHDLCSASTYFPARRSNHGTWYHGKLRRWYQNDHFVTRRSDLRRVRNA
jgi:hypothetical protein